MTSVKLFTKCDRGQAMITFTGDVSYPNWLGYELLSLIIIMIIIHWEMCKKFKFDPTNKWYIHKPAAVLRMTHTNS